MKPSKILFILYLCLSLYPLSLKSQDSIQYRKLYLHTDREYYFLGDTLWYKGYYLDGQTNEFVPGLITMYVDLVNEDGESVLDQVVPIDYGVADGAINLNGSIEPGYYMLRAFTDFQTSIGEDAFFHKKIIVAKLESFSESDEQPESIQPPEIDLSFLPEGGILLEGQMNTIGVKAIDSSGIGVPVQGNILNSRGASVATFETSYKGMGSFIFKPVKGETYTAISAAYPDLSYTFIDVVKEGIKIEFEKAGGNELHFRVVTNTSSFIGKTYYFAISHQGEVIFQTKFIPRNTIFPVTVKKEALPPGINRMVLLDEQLLPLSERLYFSTNYEINKIKIKPDQQSYETRSQVKLLLTDSGEMHNNSWSNLSIAVVDESAINKEGPSMNIHSWLLIDSELKGFIESPQDFFSDDQEMASATKLDLLMMTHGWSRYIWSKPEAYFAKTLEEKYGFSISGKVLKVIGNKPVTDGTVDLKVYNNDFMYMDIVEINEEGGFIFDDVNFMDSTNVFIQARNNKEKLAFKVSLDPLFNNFPPVSEEYVPGEEKFIQKQAQLYQKQYDNLQALKEYTLAHGTFYIDEVSVYDHKRVKDDGHFRIYAKPTNSREITNRDLAYTSVIDYIQGRFSGVTVTKNKDIVIRGPGGGLPPRIPSSDETVASRGSDRTMAKFRTEEYTSALLLLDGFPVSKDAILSIPMSDIDIVEVLKNPGETAIFGVRGAGGVVSIFTKKGGAPDYSDRYIPGTIAERLKGYASNREFYSPRYSKKNINSPKPDHRIVQFWEPNIFTEKGKASVSFFSSDDISRYKVYVEGITNDGIICLGTSEFEVDKQNDQIGGVKQRVVSPILH
jgi:hypothetical protein